MNLKTTLVALAAIGGIAIINAPAASAKEQDEIVTVKAGDTLTSIAEEHGTTYVILFNANKDVINPDVIDVGDQIRVPKADEELPDRFGELTAAPVVMADTSTPAATSATAPVIAQQSYGSTAGNTYGWGQCTWYA